MFADLRGVHRSSNAELSIVLIDGAQFGDPFQINDSLGLPPTLHSLGVAPGHQTPVVEGIGIARDDTRFTGEIARSPSQLRN